jgi:glutamyl-tRNA reductase
VYNIDDLRSVVDADLARRRQEAARAEALVQGEAVAFARWLRASQTAGPLVTSLRAKMDAVRAGEMARLRQRLPHLSPNDWQAIETATLAMVNKIAHAPTAKIKDYAADPSEAAEHKMDAARELFALDVPAAADSAPAPAAEVDAP